MNIFYKVAVYVTAFAIAFAIGHVNDSGVISREEIYLRPQESKIYPIETTDKVSIYAHAIEQGDIGVYIYQRSPTDPQNSKYFIATCFNVVACELDGLSFGPGIDSPKIINCDEKPQTIVVTVAYDPNQKDSYSNFIVPFLIILSAMILSLVA